MLQNYVRPLVLLSSAATGAAAHAQDDVTDPSFVASTWTFVFRSDVLSNLHDFLIWNAQERSTIEPNDACLSRLPSNDRDSFAEAQRYYDDAFSNYDWQAPLAVALRYELAGFPDFDILDESILSPALEVLNGARPAYEACWWPSHDVRNRRWIADLLPRLVGHERYVADRLSRAYREELNGSIPVDVTSYVHWSGANTVVAPFHIQMSSTNEGYKGDAALEMVFHEASHTLVGGGRGVDWWSALEAAASDAGLDEPPPDLWHAILFYTAGQIVRERLTQGEVRVYVPYAYRQGLFDRVWPQFREPLEARWQSYLDGNASLTDAAFALIQDVSKSVGE